MCASGKLGLFHICASGSASVKEDEGTNTRSSLHCKGIMFVC